MALTQPVAKKLSDAPSTILPSNGGRHKKHYRPRCDQCRQITDRRYLVGPEFWVCPDCVPKQVIKQYPGWQKLAREKE